MNPKIVDLEKIVLVGLSIETNLSENKTHDLWKSFKQRVGEIKNRKNDNYYSVQVYPKGMTMDDFTPITDFQKWAAVEVLDEENVPEGMQSLIIESSKYAIFRHKGIAADFFRTSQKIFGTWLPGSEYQLADRPHFEILQPDYKGPNDPDSEEDVYIPIRH